MAHAGEKINMLNIYTGPLGKFKDNGGEILDISRMTGKQGLMFAPSWELLNPYLAKRRDGVLSPEDWQGYRTAFLAEMKASAKANPDDWATWRSFIDQPIQFEFTLCCYCLTPEQCHRSIVAELLQKRGAVYLGEKQLRLL